MIHVMKVNLQAYTRELISLPCNLCGGVEVTPFCHSEKYGLPLTAVMCKGCGLMFINPRPADDQYAELNKADYRKAAIGTDSGLNHIFNKQYQHAEKTMIPLVREQIKLPVKSLLDIGCCNGGTMAAWMKYDAKIVTYGVEPVIRVAEDATRRTGSQIFQGLFEDFVTDKKFDLIICAQTLNHTLDPKGNLMKIKTMLSPNGLLFLSLYDAVSTVLNRPINQMVEIMHPFMFNDESTRYLLAKTGFEIVNINSPRFDGKKMKARDIMRIMTARILVLARPALSPPVTVSQPATSKILKRLRHNQEFYQRWAARIEGWRQPNIWRRIYRSLNR